LLTLHIYLSKTLGPQLCSLQYEEVEKDRGIEEEERSRKERGTEAGGGRNE
jgi:hypothetical protein